jgi:PAS domain S-box-containing protein
MTIEELVRALAERSETGVVLTDANPDQHGPIIRYVNPAFCVLTGYDCEDLVGTSARRFQGKATNALTVRGLLRALRSGKRFHGYLVRYRKSGQEYLCEIDVRPIVGSSGTIDYFIAFEREVRRRRGRPGPEPHSRYAVVNERAVFPE